jgi:ribonuclease P protein component
MNSPTSFPPSTRLRVSAQFQATFAEGRRLNGQFFRLHVRPLAEPGPGAASARLGITVSKRVDKHAVGRNRIKRQARECFRLRRAQLGAGDYVVLAKPEAAKADNPALRADLQGLFDRAGTLKPPARPGTMAGSAGTASASPSTES